MNSMQKKGITITNREWMESLSDHDLSLFLVAGLPLKSIQYQLHNQEHPDNRIMEDYTLGIKDIAWRYISSVSGIEDWLSQSQEFELRNN